MPYKRRSPGFRGSESPVNMRSNSPVNYRSEYKNVRNDSPKSFRDESSCKDSGNRPRFDNREREYRSVCISSIPPKMTNERLSDIVAQEFSKFGNYNLSVTVYNNDRVAYVNFKNPAHACEAFNTLKKIQIDNKMIPLRPIFHNSASYRRFSPGQRSRSPVKYKEYSDQESKSGSPRGSGKEKLGDSETRTLFVGNLGPEISEDDLRRKFEKFGEIITIDRKDRSGNSDHPGSFAFVRYATLDMAIDAKNALDGHQLSGSVMKIGFGKPSRTNCVYLSGLGPWLDFEELEKCIFQALGSASGGPRSGIKRINWPRNKSFVFVVCEAQTDSDRLVHGLQSDHRFKVGYCDMGYYRNKWDDSATGSPPRHLSRHRSSHSSSRAQRPHSRARSPRPNPPPPPPPVPPSSSQTTQRTPLSFVDTARPTWTGKIQLHNRQYGVRLHRIRGDDSLVGQHLYTPGSTDFQSPLPVSLDIQHRMSLSSHHHSSSSGNSAQLLRDIRHRLDRLRGRKYCLLLAASCTLKTTLMDDAIRPQRPLSELVEYLTSRNSSGVVFVHNEVPPGTFSGADKAQIASTNVALHIFPPCPFSYELIRHKFPNVTERPRADDFLLVLLMQDVVI